MRMKHAANTLPHDATLSWAKWFLHTRTCYVPCPRGLAPQMRAALHAARDQTGVNWQQIGRCSGCCVRLHPYDALFTKSSEKDCSSSLAWSPRGSSYREESHPVHIKAAADGQGKNAIHSRPDYGGGGEEAGVPWGPHLKKMIKPMARRSTPMKMQNMNLTMKARVVIRSMSLLEMRRLPCISSPCRSAVRNCSR
mmetsp:Transcript_4689/g.11423  ORF Transcript_4689/g.11423 Transcript_4689/m.11423 type:complete len:195 (+) Transcript_4689:290-874(+)